MTTVEDRLRDAYRAAAETVRPDGVLAQEFRAPAAGHPRRNRGHRLPRARVLALPLTAAAAVAAIAVAASMLGQHVPAAPGNHPAHHHRQQASGPPPSLDYVLAMDEYLNHPVLYAVNTQTSAETQIPLPFPEREIDDLAAGTGGTYVVAVSPPNACKSTLYRFTMTAAGQRSGLTAFLTIPVRLYSAVLAVTGDGRTVAYEGFPCDLHSNPPASRPSGATAYLALANTVTGQTRRWTFPASSSAAGGDISLSADGSTLVFGNWLLHASTPPGPLAQRGSELPDSAHFSRGALPTGNNVSTDGTTVYFITIRDGAGTDKPDGKKWFLWSYTIATRQVRMLHSLPGDPGSADAITPGPTGRYLIAEYVPPGFGPTQLVRYDLSTGAVRQLHTSHITESELAW